MVARWSVTTTTVSFFPVWSTQSKVLWTKRMFLLIHCRTHSNILLAYMTSHGLPNQTSLFFKLCPLKAKDGLCTAYSPSHKASQQAYTSRDPSECDALWLKSCAVSGFDHNTRRRLGQCAIRPTGQYYVRTSLWQTVGKLLWGKGETKALQTKIQVFLGNTGALTVIVGMPNIKRNRENCGTSVSIFHFFKIKKKNSLHV